MSEDHRDNNPQETTKDQNMSTGGIRRSGRNKVPSTLYSEHVQDLPRNPRKSVKNAALNQKSTESLTIKSENIEEPEMKEEYNEKLEKATSQVSKKTSEIHYTQSDWLPFTLLDEKNEMQESDTDKMEEEGRKVMWVSFVIEENEDSNDSMHDSARENETASYNNGTGYSTRKHRKKKKYSDEMNFLYGNEKQQIPKPKTKVIKKHKNSAAKTATPVAQKSPERTNNNPNDILLMLYNAAMNVQKEEKNKPSPVSNPAMILPNQPKGLVENNQINPNQVKESNEFEFLEEMKRKTKIPKAQTIPKLNNNIHEELPFLPLRREDERIHYVKKAIKKDGKLIFQHFNNKITELDFVQTKVRPNYNSLRNSKLLETISIEERLKDENKENEQVDPNPSIRVETCEGSFGPSETMIPESQNTPLDEMSIFKLKLLKLKKMGEEIKTHIKPSILSYY